MKTQSSKGRKPKTVREVRERAQAATPYTVIRPNSKPQEMALASDADIVVYGGSNGGGKTFTLLLEATRNLNNPQFGAVFFRRTLPEIKQEGGAWEKSEEIYPGIGGLPNLSELKWYFVGGGTVKFAAIQHDKDAKRWDSSQIALILIDQAEQFSGKILWSLISRNRSTSGVAPYMRMGCNPDPDSFLATFIAWWIGDDGYAIPERSGVVRWLMRMDDALVWADTKLELCHIAYRKYPDKRILPISVTFIVAKLSDNVDLEAKDPNYRARLELLPWAERLQKLGDDERGGNWKVKQGAGMFNEFDWRLVDGDYYPDETAFVRFWDFADTVGSADDKKTGAATASVLMGIDKEGPIVLDVTQHWISSHERDELLIRTTKADAMTYGHVVTWFEQEPASSGKRDAARNQRLIEGFESYAEPATGSKIVRARGWASAVQAKRVRVLNRGWTKGYIDQHTSFPLSKRMDLVDASTGAYTKVIETPVPDGGVGISSGHADSPNIIDQIGANTFR